MDAEYLEQLRFRAHVAASEPGRGNMVSVDPHTLLELLDAADPVRPVEVPVGPLWAFGGVVAPEGGPEALRSELEGQEALFEGDR